MAHCTPRLRQLRGPHGGSGAEPYRLEACGKQHVTGRCDMVWPVGAVILVSQNVAETNQVRSCTSCTGVPSWSSFGLPLSQRNDAELCLLIIILWYFMRNPIKLHQSSTAAPGNHTYQNLHFWLDINHHKSLPSTIPSLPGPRTARRTECRTLYINIIYIYKRSPRCRNFNTSLKSEPFFFGILTLLRVHGKMPTPAGNSHTCYCFFLCLRRFIPNNNTHFFFMFCHS